MKKLLIIGALAGILGGSYVYIGQSYARHPEEGSDDAVAVLMRESKRLDSLTIDTYTTGFPGDFEKKNIRLKVSADAMGDFVVYKPKNAGLNPCPKMLVSRSWKNSYTVSLIRPSNDDFKLSDTALKYHIDVANGIASSF